MWLVRLSRTCEIDPLSCRFMQRKPRSALVHIKSYGFRRQFNYHGLFVSTLVSVEYISQRTKYQQNHPVTHILFRRNASRYSHRIYGFIIQSNIVNANGRTYAMLCYIIDVYASLVKWICDSRCRRCRRHCRCVYCYRMFQQGSAVTETFIHMAPVRTFGMYNIYTGIFNVHI